MKIIISGGGTGGHIFPAISIANAIKRRNSEAEILFVGALGRMEMEKVPSAGYKIEGLPIAGFPRKISLQSFSFFIKLFKSLRLAKKIIKDFKPDAVVGVGGYASGPLLIIASNLGIPALIQEQNSYAGITNKLLSKRVQKICVAYENMEQFFPVEKIVITGNPIRNNLINKTSSDEALSFFNLDKTKKTILIIGGSLGAATLNNSVLENLSLIKQNSDIQWILQTGKFYSEKVKNALANQTIPNLQVYDFISQMDLAYKAANLVVSRAGAGTISELCILGKASILVPSPNVAEDHQTKNAMALSEKKAAILIKDSDASKELIQQAIKKVRNTDELNLVANNALKMALPNSDELIVDELFKMIK
jgi:UDP-N-acetylglucosamine--N-acetylmuramyl-(pentapeptide) pyrophosphoryl-undecaprenol N-acetylglucosamine transferase